MYISTQNVKITPIVTELDSSFGPVYSEYIVSVNKVVLDNTPIFAEATGATNVTGYGYLKRKQFELPLNVYPNPFGKGVIINLSNRPSYPNRIYIINVKGKLVKSYNIKEDKIIWDGSDNEQKRVEAGIYFIQLEGLPGAKKVIISR